MADDGALILQSELAEELRQAARDGGYGSPEELLRDTLNEIRRRREEAETAEAKLQAFLQAGIDDVKAGRIADFDLDGIVQRGRKRLAALRG